MLWRSFHFLSIIKMIDLTPGMINTGKGGDFSFSFLGLFSIALHYPCVSSHKITYEFIELILDLHVGESQQTISESEHYALDALAIVQTLN